MFEVRHYLRGLRVCVRWLPIKPVGGASFINPHVSAAAVFTCPAIRPVNSNPSRNLIPKNEIIWHMESPPMHQAITVPQRGNPVDPFRQRSANDAEESKWHCKFPIQPKCRISTPCTALCDLQHPRFTHTTPRRPPKNTEGAGSMRVANYLYNAAPRDGTSFGTISRGTGFEPLLGDRGARFAATAFN